MAWFEIFVDKNAIKHTFSHNGESYFSVEFNGEFFLVLREFWTIFSKTHWKAVYKQTFSEEKEQNSQLHVRALLRARWSLETFAIISFVAVEVMSAEDSQVSGDQPRPIGVKLKYAWWQE